MKTIITAATCVFALASTAANAQILTIATTNPGGLAHSIGSAIAKTLTETAGIRTVVVPAGGSPMPAVVGGEADCGVNVAFDVSYYVEGTKYYAKDGAHKNLRMVGAVLPSLVSMYVKNDSDVKSLADFKGKRIPGGFNAQLAIGEIYETYLKFAGLDRKDVQTVPAQSIVQAANDFAAGRNDMFLFSVGTAKVLEVDSSVGGLRALSVDDSKENRAILSKSLPGAYLTTLQPDGSAKQIVAPTNVVTFDLVLFCANTVPDKTIYAVSKGIHDNKARMAESFKAMNRFAPEKMAPEVPGVDYHPGAIKYFKEAGLWPPKS